MSSGERYWSSSKAAFALWIGAFVLFAACRQEDASVRVEAVVLERAQGAWRGAIPRDREGLFSYRSSGTARLDGSWGYLRGKEAFDAARTRGGNDPIALAILAMLFLDDDVAGRKVAATALGELRHPAVRDALQRAERGDDGRVQVLAVEALKKLK